MKFLEIFYLMIIFNVIMSIIGGLNMANGNPIQTKITGDSEGGENHDPDVTLTGFVALMSGAIASLAIIYGVSGFLPGAARTPMALIYTVVFTAFELSYMGAFGAFWVPLAAATGGILDAFLALITFLIQMVFILGFLQMTTGGWGLYK